MVELLSPRLDPIGTFISFGKHRTGFPVTYRHELTYHFPKSLISGASIPAAAMVPAAIDGAGFTGPRLVWSDHAAPPSSSVNCCVHI